MPAGYQHNFTIDSGTMLEQFVHRLIDFWHVYTCAEEKFKFFVNSDKWP